LRALVFGFADSRAQSRQLVLHGHIMVNGKKADVPSEFLKEGDTISWREGSKKTDYYKVISENIESKNIATWLSLDRQNMTGQVITLPTPDQADAKFDGKAVIEYYSR